MKNINFKKSVLVCALSLGSIGVANATIEPVNVGFTTIVDVAIVATQELSFGTTVYSALGGVCTMDAAVANINDNDAAITPASPVTGGTGGSVVGTGCITSAMNTAPGNQLGIYTLTGTAGANVKVTVTGVSGTDFTFAPVGCIPVYTGLATASECVPFTVGNATTTTDIADLLDLNATPGELRVVVGGVMTIGGTDLTPETTYTQTFDIQAIY